MYLQTWSKSEYMYFPTKVFGNRFENPILTWMQKDAVLVIQAAERLRKGSLDVWSDLGKQS